MKRFISFMTFALLVFNTIVAQNNAGTIDDIGRVAIVPMIASNSKIPKNSSNMMLNKMRTAIVRTGLGASSGNARFVITVNSDELTRDITPTAPPMMAVTIAPTFYIGDLQEGTLFASISLPAVKGVGSSAEKAYMAALRNINLNSPDFTSFVNNGRTRIVEYYNTNIHFLLKEAEAKAAKDDFDGAISLLMSVPSVCADAHKQAMDKVSGIWQRKIDKSSAESLAKAKQAWNASLDLEGASAAGALLEGVHPNSSSAKEATSLMQSISKRVKEISDREWALEERAIAFQEQQARDAVELEKASINAAKEVAVALASQPVYYTNVVYWW